MMSKICTPLSRGARGLMQLRQFDDELDVAWWSKICSAFAKIEK
jgi:hypothetical protein